jgi:hypothetical protein
MATRTKILIIWSLAIVAGAAWMADYASRPGPSATIPEFQSGVIGSGSKKPQLMVFLHPYCPCSRATLSELERLQARYPVAFDIHAFVYKPADKKDDWARTDIWQKAVGIGGVNVSILSDEDLKQYEALTSGQVILYDAEQRPVFSGGITRGRGHEGDNLGRQSIERYLETGVATVVETPVFGCIIRSP